MTDPITIQRLLVQFDASDMTQRDFARQVEVRYSTFTSWLRKRRQQPPDTDAQWVEVPVPAEAQSSSHTGACIVEWPQGMKLRVAGNFDCKAAAELFKLINQQCSL